MICLNHNWNLGSLIPSIGKISFAVYSPYCTMVYVFSYLRQLNAFLYLKNAETLNFKSEPLLIDFISNTGGSYTDLLNLTTNTLSTTWRYTSYSFSRNKVILNTNTTSTNYKIIVTNNDLPYSTFDNLTGNTSLVIFNDTYANSPNINNFKFYFSSETSVNFNSTVFFQISSILGGSNNVLQGNHTNWYPKLWYCADYDDNTAETLSELKERAKTKCVVLRPNKIIKIVVKPAVTVQTYRTATSTGYAPTWNQWIDMANRDVPHYGLKFVVDCCGQDPLDTYPFKLEIDRQYYFTCKDVR